MTPSTSRSRCDSRPSALARSAKRSPCAWSPLARHRAAVRATWASISCAPISRHLATTNARSAATRQGRPMRPPRPGAAARGAVQIARLRHPLALATWPGVPPARCGASRALATDSICNVRTDRVVVQPVLEHASLDPGARVPARAARWSRARSPGRSRSGRVPLLIVKIRYGTARSRLTFRLTG